MLNRKKRIDALSKEIEEFEEAEQLEILEKKLARLKQSKSRTLADGTKIEMRKPTLLDLKQMEEGKTDAEKELILFRNLSGKTEEQINALSTDDYAIYQKILQNFMS